MIGFFMFIMWALISGFSLFLNRDIFSPTKFYLLNIGAYFGLIFIKSYEDVIYVYYLIFLALGLIFIIVEPKVKLLHKMKSYINVNIDLDRKSMKKSILAIWIISAIPIIAQLYLIQYTGGIFNYVNNIGLRVVAWRGMGAVLELIKMFAVINLFYFAVLLIQKNTKIRDWIPYLIHFSVFLLIGFLSGSRGGLLWNIVFMLVAYHYLKKRVTLRKALTYALILLVFASLLGTARNGYKLTSEGFRTGLSTYEQSFDLKQFEYGIIPIQLLYQVDNSELEYGMTYLTPITNIIPRKIWPGKPDTGGIIFTQRYTGNAWGGYSHLATGIIAEGVINFGMLFGPIVGIVVFLIVMWFVFKYYRKTIGFDITSMKHIVVILSYIYIVTSLPGLVKAEWTNAILDVTFKVIKLWIVYYSVYFIPKKILR